MDRLIFVLGAALLGCSQGEALHEGDVGVSEADGQAELRPDTWTPDEGGVDGGTQPKGGVDGGTQPKDGVDGGTQPDAVADAVVQAEWRRHACGVPLIEVEVDPAEFENMKAYPWSKIELPCRVTMFGRSFEGAEIEIHGNWARDQPKKSYRIKVPKDGPAAPALDPFGDGPEPIRRLVLSGSWNDATYARGKIAMDLARDLGAHAPRTSHAVLQVNGAFVGLYALIERIDKEFLRKRSWSTDGNLYKAETHEADWKAKPNALDGFEKKTNEAGPSDDLAQLLEALTNTPAEAAAFGAKVEPLLNLEHHQIWNMINTFSANGDTWTKNYYLYHDPAAEPGQPGARFQIIHWDADTVFGITFDGTPISTVEEHTWRGWDEFSPRLYDNIREFRLPYLQAYERELESGALALEPLKERVRALRNQLHSCIATDLVHWERDADVEQEFVRLEQMVEERHTVMLPRVKEVLSWD